MNKTGLQPASRPVEQVCYLRGLRVGAKSLDSKAVQINYQKSFGATQPVTKPLETNQPLKVDCDTLPLYGALKQSDLK